METMRLKEVVFCDRSLGRLKRPRMVVNFSPIDLAPRRLRVETVTFREPVIERASLALIRLTCGPIRGFEFDAAGAREAKRLVLHLIGKSA